MTFTKEKSLLSSLATFRRLSDTIRYHIDVYGGIVSYGG